MTRTFTAIAIAFLLLAIVARGDEPTTVAPNQPTPTATAVKPPELAQCEAENRSLARLAQAESARALLLSKQLGDCQVKGAGR